MTPRISLIIPTQRRPEPLTRAMRSAIAQQGVDPAELELIIADNDQAPSARTVVDRLRGEAAFDVVYVHEPKPGVANIRNAAMEAARGELIAFLDDDEEAPPGWLAALLKVQRDHQADVVFGPVLGRAPAGVIRHRAYFERFFSRLDSAPEGVIDHYYGCGDSLVRRAALADPRRPFSETRNHIGGEDDQLFAGMKAAGARFAWAPEAWVWEDPAPERLRLGYTLRRAFAYGHGPVVQCATRVPPDRLGIARWAVIGTGQALVFGLLALVLCAIRAPNRAFMLDRTARGLGKVFWGGPFVIRFYGLSAAAASPVNLSAPS
jgi:glycosyltransferase involved in cell wall biosynthesis